MVSKKVTKKQIDKADKGKKEKEKETKNEKNKNKKNVKEGKEQNEKVSEKKFKGKVEEKEIEDPEVTAQIELLRNCQENDNIFNFINAKYKKHYIELNENDAKGKNTKGPYVFFESVNAFELKKYKISQCIFDIIFQMTKKNMEELYNKSDFLDKGWSDDKKMKELKSNKCKLILGFLNKNATEDHTSVLDIIQNNEEKKLNTFLKKHKLICFVHYRLIPDYHPNHRNIICYLYEIQVNQEYTKLGIGRRLIEMLEKLCKKIQIRKILCTVLKLNERATLFYKNKCSFEIDENNPDNFIESDKGQCEYEILKKTIPI